MELKYTVSEVCQIYSSNKASKQQQQLTIKNMIDSLLNYIPIPSQLKWVDSDTLRNFSASSGKVLINFSLTVKAATLIIIYGRGLAISFAKQGKSGSMTIW